LSRLEYRGLKPARKDLEKYMVKKLVDKLRREIEEKYSHIPEDARQRFVESELKLKLKEEL